MKKKKKKDEYANVADEDIRAEIIADIEAKIEKGIEDEAKDDHNYINLTAMGKIAELSAQLKEEMLAVESLEDKLTAFEQ